MHASAPSSFTVGARIAGAVRAAAVMLVPIFVATGCVDVFGLASQPQIFVLTYVGGVALDTSENLLVRCLPRVAEQGRGYAFLGDTLFLRSSGRGTWISHQRSWQPDGDSTLFFHFEAGYEFRYFRDGRRLTLWNDEARSDLRFVEDGALEIAGFCGSLRYERASSAAP